MSFIANSYFWGFILILLGISMIIKTVFKISIPLVRILFALFIIYLGLKMLMGSFGFSNNSVLFSEKSFKYTGKIQSYNVVFGENFIDLTDVHLYDNHEQININVIFGESIIKIDKNLPVDFDINTAFGSVNTPQGSFSSFGKENYKSQNISENQKNVLSAKINVTFGEVKIIN
ncbi:MAG: LiaF-related protein [Candidatus Cloacimonadota bacterium]|nr:LiaF-related protein [Candidatus Cloacimonadota bacterium]